MIEERVFIAGAGPVGMYAAARLANFGIPVTVFEGGSTLNKESRASTFHPSSLDLLNDLGVVDDLIKCGLKSPYLQYRDKANGLIARFDFGDIADLTKHPYRLQAEQWHLTHILLEKLKDNPLVDIQFNHEVVGCTQNEDSATLEIKHNGETIKRSALWVIGADGANSAVRRSNDIGFDGFTWPERFLVLSTPFDFSEQIEELDTVSYVADPDQWYFLLRIPGLWRAMFPIDPDTSDEDALSEDYGQKCLNSVIANTEGYEVVHQTLYRVHQRVADTFRIGKRVMLAGDAAHINNPLGGMGMNGGLHDAENLVEKLWQVWTGEMDDSILDKYDLQRRGITHEAVQANTIRNKKELEAKTPEDQKAFRDFLLETKNDKEKTRQFLKRVSMISSLERAAELA